MKCGNTRVHGAHEHATVADVRACYSGGTSNPFDYSPKNQYAGKCTRCGARVEAGAGRVDRKAAGAGGGWDLTHLDGQCPQASVTPLAPARTVGAVERRFSPIQAGHYATKSATGSNDLDFWKVDRPAGGKWAGYVFVERVIGGHPDASVRGATRQNALKAILDAGPDEAARLYGQTLGQCSRCNRSLTDETSRALGIGPTCRSGA